MVKLGDKIKKTISLEGELRGNQRVMVRKYAEGEVVYIDPKGRWYSLLFKWPGGCYQESFPMVEGKD